MLPTTGPLNMGLVRSELSASGSINLGSSAVRGLATVGTCRLIDDGNGNLGPYAFQYWTSANGLQIMPNGNNLNINSMLISRNGSKIIAFGYDAYGSPFDGLLVWVYQCKIGKFYVFVCF